MSIFAKLMHASSAELQRFGLRDQSNDARQRKFRCPVCSALYDTVDEMLACMNQPVTHGPFKVGDIVMLSNKWRGEAHNIPRDDPWIACIRLKNKNSADHFDHVDQFYPWYVITHLRDYEHEEIATVVSLMGDVVSAGWNPTVAATHCCMWKAGEPIIDWAHTQGWPDEFKHVEIRTPGEAMLVQARALAERGWVSYSLI